MLNEEKAHTQCSELRWGEIREEIRHQDKDN